jgi:osmotically inducible protein OsmC
MALSMILDNAGYKVEQIHTIARVHIDKVGEGFKITTIELETEGKVPGIDERTFREKAETAKKGCPVSMALTGVDIRLQARLVQLAA